MVHELIRHPDTPCDAVDRIDVAVARPQSGMLALRYTVSGRIAGVRIAPPTEPLRADQLWQTTCFAHTQHGTLPHTPINMREHPATLPERCRASRPRGTGLAIVGSRIDLNENNPDTAASRKFTVAGDSATTLLIRPGEVSIPVRTSSFIGPEQ